MSTKNLEIQSNPYNQTFRNNAFFHSKKKSIETSETVNESLPNIHDHQDKRVNVIRNDLNDTKSQIALMKAKIKNLSKIREKMESKTSQNMTKIQFITGVKERLKSDAEYKDKFLKKREEETQARKFQAEQLRQSLVKDRKNAEKLILDSKIREASEERRRKKQYDYLIKKLKQMQQNNNINRADKVKQFHQSSSSRLKQFHQSRINFSKDNYHKKVILTMKERQKANSQLKRLKQQQSKLLEDVKTSEKAMLTSLYSLETANPQKRKKFRFNSDRSLKYEHNSSEYDNQEFEN